jgi:hypothetical protein
MKVGGAQGGFRHPAMIGSDAEGIDFDEQTVHETGAASAFERRTNATLTPFM